jgi:hypothetical protein
MLSPLPRTRFAARRRALTALPLAAVVVALLGLSPAGGTTRSVAAPPPAPPLDAGLAKLQRLATGLPTPARSSVRRTGVHAAANPATTTVSDPPNDAAGGTGLTFTATELARADLADPTNAAGIRVGAGSVTLSAKIPLTANPTTDISWLNGDTGITWALSVWKAAPTGNINYLANIGSDKLGHMIGGVFANPAPGLKPPLLCYANAAWDRVSTFSLSFSSACIGVDNTWNIQFYAQAVYDTTLGNDSNPQMNQPHDYAPGGPPAGPSFSGVVSPDTTPTPIAGGLAADKFGAVRPFTIGSSTSPPTQSTYWNFDIARDLAMFPDGAHGFVLDGRGGLWGVALGQNFLPVAPIGNAYWTTDIARGVAVMPDGTGGFVADGWGGLHWFSIGAPHSAPAVNGGSYWQGWDIVRGVTILPDSSGGFVLDAWGGLHPFGLGSSPAPSVMPSPGGPYWKPWYVARGVTVLPDRSGGYIGDAWGVHHPFSLGGTPPPTSGGPYWPNQDMARGASVLWGALPLP